MLAPLHHVTEYNNISRLFLKLPANQIIDKQETLNSIRAMKHDKQAQLLSKLIAIKYYRQTGSWNNVEDIPKQNQYWQEIVASDLLPKNTQLFELKAFIKNDGLIVQRKITSEFKDLLAVSVTKKQRIVNNFTEGDRENMCSFLSDATGEDWNNPVPRTQVVAAVEKERLEFDEKSIHINDRRWLELINKLRDECKFDFPFWMLFIGEMSVTGIINKLNNKNFDEVFSPELGKYLLTHVNTGYLKDFEERVSVLQTAYFTFTSALCPLPKHMLDPVSSLAPLSRSVARQPTRTREAMEDCYPII